MRARPAVPVLLVALAGACASLGRPAARVAGPRELDHVTPEERLQYIRRAKVWAPTRIAEMDFIKGPEMKGAFPFDARVTCTYVTPDEPLGGQTPKFLCDLGGGDVVKVKFGRRNGEVYAGVATSRLLWALGFFADGFFPVQVTCRDCPVEPWWWSDQRPRADEKTYEIASIERKLPGKRIESREDEGWRFPEIDAVDESAGGAPRAQRDALKLLMVLLQNSDTKADNQRLLCPEEAVAKDALGNETCSAPVMYVHDVGYGFGEAQLFDNSKTEFRDWEQEPVWKDRARCVGNLKKSLLGTFGDPPIREAGRKFLADLLAQLSDRQIEDMFTAARMDRVHVHPERNHPVAEWVRVFKAKRDEIAGATCPQ